MLKSKINVALLIHFISIVLIFESVFMFLAVVVSGIYHEHTTTALSVSALITLLIGITLNTSTKKQRKIEPTKRESFFIVSISWFVLGIVGTIPYLVTHSIPEFTDAFFESISGFTTTGSSILSDIESLPKSILFWRAETHWIGGMGIIVLVLAVMPFLNINGIYLFSSESSNVANEKISTRIKYTAQSLWLVYLGLTVLEIIFLRFGNMSLFQSICHSFATVATGGFSTQNDSIAGYSNYIQYIISLFMLLSGINFALHVLMLKGKYRSVIKNEELQFFLTVVLMAVIVITIFLYSKQNMKLEPAFRESLFQVISIITATGFATADYLQWPVQAVIVIALLMLFGASSGSTGGGVKAIRHLMVLKNIKHSFQMLASPNRICVVKYNHSSVSQNFTSNIFTFIFIYYFIILTSTVIMIISGYDVSTSFGASATCLGGIGPGFGKVGPTSNFYFLTPGIKYFLTVIMIVGRLEIFSFLIIFTRSFWV